MYQNKEAKSKNTSTEELLFTERRILVNHYEGSPNPMTNESLQMAVTANVKLSDYGYSLKPDAIVQLAKYPSSVAEDLVKTVQKYSDKVPAAPMYPDFPNQVMQMDEAQYRLQQFAHYMSTYGIELLTGENVSRGWLPSDAGTDKTEDDISLLKAKTLDLLSKYEAYETTLKGILSKKTRMTIPERDLCMQILDELNSDPNYLQNPLQGITIPFKENMEQIFVSILFDPSLDLHERVTLLKSLCMHSGDVIKGLAICLRQSKWHLTTSQKKTFVRLLESYSVSDLAENLWLSKSKSEKAKRYLNEISYNAFSKDPQKKAVVKAARDNQLSSFESRVKRVLKEDPNEAAEMASSRPGWFLRMLTFFYRNGVSKEELSKDLCRNADKLSISTMLSVLNAFSDMIAESKANVDTTGDTQDDDQLKEQEGIFDIVKTALGKHLERADTKIAGQKIFIDAGEFSLNYSCIEGNEKSADGGYFASGMAYKIPEDAKDIRFFVYWDDENRVDVDLHAFALKQDGSQLHVGWNSEFRDGGIVMSGDITHSNAAEYIDIDLDNPNVSCVNLVIHLFSGKSGFDTVKTCYAGLMAVNELGESVKLYNPKNCFISNELRQNTRMIWYGYIDVQNRILVYMGRQNKIRYALDRPFPKPMFSLQDYLSLLIQMQNAKLVESKEDADMILVLRKAQEEKELSLIDENFFEEC